MGQNVGKYSNKVNFPDGTSGYATEGMKVNTNPTGKGIDYIYTGGQWKKVKFIKNKKYEANV